jgi:hypothetical protein
MCVACGGLNDRCCAGSSCRGDAVCEDGFCREACPASLGAPGLPSSMTAYQDYCVATDGPCIPLDENDNDLCFPRCEIQNATIVQLVEEGTIPCSLGLNFLFDGVEGADRYQVYTRNYETGALKNNGAGTSTTAYSDTSIQNDPKYKDGQALLFHVAVRATATCRGNELKGPPDLGMIAVTNRCF